ncbi:MAG: cysteine--tRNA ligase, partial [Candidatus Nitrosopelagicus sp.]|nr:cysteine--tRNA ligase [Candidatus Nitrosopelagicus sp.]
NWGPNIIRLFCLSGHYSKVIDYSEDMLKENLTKWRQAETCYYELIHADSENQEDSSEIIKKTSAEFDDALEDDFNTHLALSAFFQLVKEVNRLAAEEKLGKDESLVFKKEFTRMMVILGLKIPEMTENEKQNIDELIENREKFRKEKQFEKADEVRDKLNEMNIELIDHKGKTIWMKKEKIKSEN